MLFEFYCVILMPEKEEKPIDVGKEENEVLTQTETQSQEIGGRRNGLDPTRYGDWEKNGRCIDF